MALKEKAQTEGSELKRNREKTSEKQQDNLSSTENPQLREMRRRNERARFLRTQNRIRSRKKA